MVVEKEIVDASVGNRKDEKHDSNWQLNRGEREDKKRGKWWCWNESEIKVNWVREKKVIDEVETVRGEIKEFRVLRTKF